MLKRWGNRVSPTKQKESMMLNALLNEKPTVLQALIHQKLLTVDLKELSHLLGYRGSDKFKQRLTAMFSNDYFGLDSSNYDFQFSSEEFVRQLCNHLNIPSLLVDKVLDEIKVELEKQKNASKPFIFIDTDFKRKSEPIAVLSAMQKKRYFTIEDAVAVKSLDEQLQDIQEIVTTHYQTHPILDLGGEVQRYAYFYQADYIVVFSVTGEILDVTNDYPLSVAKLRL